jgi:hypothetical protein
VTADLPERALERARARAAEAREAGEYGDAERFSALETTPGKDLLRLNEWAFLEVDHSQIYSTRRFGAPITLLKRGLLRLLRQYHGQLLAQQTRFNLHLLGEVGRLQARVARLERGLPETDDDRR